MKKILFIGYGIDERRKESISLNTYSLVNLLKSEGYKVYLINVGYKDKKFGLSMFKAILNRNKIVAEIKDFLKKEKIDFIHDVFALPVSSYLFTAPLIDCFPEITFIKEIQNTPGFSPQIHKESFLRTFANSDFFLKIVKNKFDKLITRNYFLSQKMKIGYLPISIPIYKENQKEIKIPLKVCYLGHPLKKKGVYEFPKIIKNLPLSLKTKVVFNFAFSKLGKKEKLIERIKKEAVKNQIQVNFYGEVNPENFFRKNDIFLYPLQDEYGAASIPRSILEAMEAGCLVVVTKTNLTLGLIKNLRNGIFFKRHQAQGIIQTLEFLVRNSNKIRTITKEARKTIIENFNREKLEERIKTIYG